MKAMKYVTALLAIFAAMSIQVRADALPSGAHADEAILQKTCPVMVGNAIDPNLHVDYQGKRVYFCCNMCVGEFQKNPEKYLDRLPQFNDEASHETDNESSTGFNLREVIGPLGITTFAFLSLTVLTALLRRKLKSRFMITHKVLAYSTLTLAALHGLLVFLTE